LIERKENKKTVDTKKLTKLDIVCTTVTHITSVEELPSEGVISSGALCWGLNQLNVNNGRWKERRKNMILNQFGGKKIGQFPIPSCQF